MKPRNIQLLSLALLTLLISVTSCKKSKDSGSSSQFSATIGSTTFQSIETNAFLQGSDLYVEGMQAKSGGDTTVLQLDIPSSATVNTKLSFDDVYVSYFNVKGTIDFNSWTNNSHGTVTLTTYDKTNKKIAGNFSGVLYSRYSSTDSIVISNGQFNTTYQ